MGIKIILKNAHFTDVIESVTNPVLDYSTGRFTSANPVDVDAIQDTRKLCVITADSGATIYYTTDGSTPTTSSSQYSSPIVLNGNETIKAIAVLNGDYSDVATLDVSSILLDVTKTVSISSSVPGGNDTLRIRESYDSSVFAQPFFAKIILKSSRTLAASRFQTTYGSGNTINPYPFSSDYTFEGNVEAVTFTGTASNKSYDRINGNLYKQSSTPYAAWGEGQITLHFQYIKANAVATGDTATGSGTSGTLFSNLDPTKQYGVKVVVTNATPSSGKSAINCMLRDKQGGNGAAGNIFMTANGTYMIPVFLDDSHKNITFNCYNGTCNLACTLYELS